MKTDNGTTEKLPELPPEIEEIVRENKDKLIRGKLDGRRSTVFQSSEPQRLVHLRCSACGNFFALDEEYIISYRDVNMRYNCPYCSACGPVGDKPYKGGSCSA